jgi:YggT family protein
MQNALLFIVRTLFDLYLLCFVLRFALQWARTDRWNPLVQFILRVTNPVVLPLRRLVPALGPVDTATVLAVFVLQLVAIVILVRVGCAGSAGVLQLLLLTVLALVHLVLRVWFWAILIWTILSWVSPGRGNPGQEFLGALVSPLIRPIRRLVPPIGGLDLSPLFALIALQAVTLLLPTESALAGLACGPIARPVF